MKHFTKIFFRGLLTLLPITLSVYILYLFFTYFEALAKKILGLVYTGPYIPGMGIVLGVIAIYLLGLLMTSSLVNAFYQALEMPFRNVPLVKSIYTAIQDLTQYFNPSKKTKGQVVLVKIPNYEMEIVGFLTRENLHALPDGVTKPGRVAVYLPLSYQIGGYTIFVPEEWVTKLDLPVEVAMKSTLTAWMHAE